ncbi:MAG: methyltransferase domain-containing protein [Chloroflexi bacterium]|nr:methyltransferase domain-containing protein [Chloroflexota bacterium]
MSSKEDFDRVAHRSDEMREELYSEAVRDVAFATADLQRGRIAADIGAGTGFVTEGLVARGLRVIAVDRSENMLVEMRRRFAGEETIDYRVGEAHHLPIADRTVDYAFANMYLHHVESPHSAIGELIRILSPGGRLVVTDLDKHDLECLKEGHHYRWMGFGRVDIVRWLERSGLRNVAVGSAGEVCRVKACVSDGYFSVGIFVASGDKWSSEAS